MPSFGREVKYVPCPSFAACQRTHQFFGNCGSDGKIGGREKFPPLLVEVSCICMMRGASGDEFGNYLLGVRTQ
jgi:hypothetical protein